MRTILNVVMAHREAQAAVNRHKKYWHACGDVVYVTPLNSPLPDSSLPFVEFNMAQHAGFEANSRVISALRWAINQPYGFIAFHEYDSFMLEPPSSLPFPGEIWAPAFRDTREERGFVGTTFTHPPLFMGRATCIELVSALDRVTPHAERGFWDRMVGLAIEQTPSIKLVNMWEGGRCFAKNPIEGSTVEEACAAVRHGARWIHGIKTPEALVAIESALNHR
jgi:hypothetical protein